SDNDLEQVLADLEACAIMPEEEVGALKTAAIRIVKNHGLRQLLSGNDTLYCERDILAKADLVLRPDRVNINPNIPAAVSDYKTASQKATHHGQLLRYANALQDMGYSVSEKILIYSNQNEVLIKKV